VSAIRFLLSAGDGRPERLIARSATRGAVRPRHPKTEVNAAFSAGGGSVVPELRIVRDLRVAAEMNIR
jgi:hypothetical protein